MRQMISKQPWRGYFLIQLILWSHDHIPTNLISTDHQEQVIKYLLLLFPLTVPYCASLENASPISDLLSVHCNHAKYLVNWHYMDEVN